MKACELIEQLQKLDPNSVIEIYDPDAERYLPISGVVHDPATKETQLYADTDDCGDVFEVEFQDGD